MGYNIDQEFIGAINFVAAACNKRKAITSNDLEKFSLIEGFFLDTIVSEQRRKETDILNDLSSIIEPNVKLAEGLLKN